MSMNAQPQSSSAAPEGARCQSHPEQPALGACARCGGFYCREDHEIVEGKVYCSACAGRPDVDYLEGFRLKYWGRRDTWTWMVGLGALVNLGLGLFLLSNGNPDVLLIGLFSLASAAVGACFWWGLPWARQAFLFVPVVSLLIGVATGGASAVVRGMVPIGITYSIYNSTRNKLFFKQEVSREALKTAWDLYMNNTMARAGFLLGFMGLLVPGVGLIALLCSVLGLRRVNPDAHPPIGRKGMAIAGIVLGAVGSLGWGAFLVNMLLRRP
jgi:hypothetical protein